MGSTFLELLLQYSVDLPEELANVEQVGDICIFRLSGVPGTKLGGQLQHLGKVLSAHEEEFDHHTLLDFANVTNVDSSTVAFMVNALGRRVKRGRRLALINAPEKLRVMLDLAKLEGMLRGFDTEEEALAYLRGQGE